MWIQEKEVITLKTTKDISFPQARRLVEHTNGPVTYAKVASYPKPILRDSPKRKIQLDGMKSISKTTHTTSGTPTPTDVGSKPDASTTPPDSAYPLNQRTKTTANLTKTSQSVFSTPIQSDNRSEDSDNMATEENSLGKEDKNPQESHEMASEEELSSGDEDSSYERIIGNFFKGHIFTEEYRKEVQDKCYKPTCTLLAMAGLHGARKILEKRMKMDTDMIPEDTDINGKEAMQVISNYRFSEEQYRVLCLLAGHKMATATKKMALYFKKNR